jgi:hypothetical protein
VTVYVCCPIVSETGVLPVFYWPKTGVDSLTHD